MALTVYSGKQKYSAETGIVLYKAKMLVPGTEEGILVGHGKLLSNEKILF